MKKTTKDGHWNTTFNARENDTLAVRGLVNELSVGEINGLLRETAHDERFRDSFSEWVKAFRDPGTATSRRRKLRTS